MKYEKGQSGNPAGKPRGIENKTTAEFKEALNRLLEHAAPNMIAWLDKIAQDDPGKALDHVGKLAEYVHPKLARSELSGNMKVQFEPLVMTQAQTPS